MGNTLYRWQPTGPALLQETEAILNAQLRRWSTTWFVESSFAVADLKPLSPRQVPETATGDWQLHANGLATRLLPTAKERLTNRALDRGDAVVVRAEVDKQLLDRLHRSLVDDLVRTLGAGFVVKSASSAADTTTSHRFDAGGGVRGWIKDNAHGQYGEVAIPIGLILSASKAVTNTPKAAPKRLHETLAARSIAWGPTSLTFEARLGRTHISYGDLQSLAPGDVLILDQSLESAIALTLVNSSKAVVTGNLCQSGEQVALHINNSHALQPDNQSQMS
jgi:hypothetical protein